LSGPGRNSTSRRNPGVWRCSRKIARAANYACSFDTPDFPDHRLYSGDPWFLPAVGGWYRLRDRIDRLLA